MTMTTRTIVEDIPNSMNRRYFAEVDADDEVKIQREGDTVAEAARKAVSTLRYKADDAERKFVESGVLPRPDPVTELDRGTVLSLLDRASRDATDAKVPESVREAVAAFVEVAAGRARIA